MFLRHHLMALQVVLKHIGVVHTVKDYPNHIAYLAFNQKPNQGGKNLISQKIRDFLDNDEGWRKGERPKQKRLFKGGTPVPYYERI